MVIIKIKLITIHNLKKKIKTTRKDPQQSRMFPLSLLKFGLYNVTTLNTFNLQWRFLSKVLKATQFIGVNLQQIPDLCCPPSSLTFHLKLMCQQGNTWFLNELDVLLLCSWT